MTFVVCESTAAIVTHLRLVGDKPISLSGHSFPKPEALCGVEIAWDTKLPINAVRCRACMHLWRVPLGLVVRGLCYGWGMDLDWWIKLSLTERLVLVEIRAAEIIQEVMVLGEGAISFHEWVGLGAKSPNGLTAAELPGYIAGCFTWGPP